MTPLIKDLFVYCMYRKPREYVRFVGEGAECTKIFSVQRYYSECLHIIHLLDITCLSLCVLLYNMSLRPLMELLLISLLQNSSTYATNSTCSLVLTTILHSTTSKTHQYHLVCEDCLAQRLSNVVKPFICSFAEKRVFDFSRNLFLFNSSISVRSYFSRMSEVCCRFQYTLNYSGRNL